MQSVGMRGDGASVDFFEAVRRGFGRSTVYGRASRSEFWYFALFCAVLNFCSILVLDDLLGMASLDQGVGLILSIFQTVVFVRRLHDVGRSGWWAFIALTIVGIIPLFVWSVKKGEPKRNRFDIIVDQKSISHETALSIDRIEQLDKMRRSGVLTDAEYQTVKKAAL